MPTTTDEECTRMAGSRRATGRPRQDLLRAQRRLASLQAELDRARTPLDQVIAAYDFLRGALKHADPATAETITDEVTRILTDAGTRALSARRESA